MKKYFLTLGLVAVTATPAFAEGGYIFGDLGQSKIEVDYADRSETNTSYSFGLGYALNKTFALELGYRDLGDIKLYRDEYGTGVADGSAIQLSLLAKYPVNDKVNVFGRLGFAGVTFDSHYKYFSNNFSEDYSHSDEQNKSLVGVGAEYILNEHLSLRAEYNHYGKYDQLETSTLSVGAVYSF